MANDIGFFEITVSRVRVKMWMRYLNPETDLSLFSVHYRHRRVVFEFATKRVSRTLTSPYRPCNGMLLSSTGRVNRQNFRAEMDGIQVERDLTAEVLPILEDYVSRHANRTPISVYIHLTELEAGFMVRQHEDVVSLARIENQVYERWIAPYFPEQQMGVNFLNYQQVLLPPIGGGAYMRLRLPSYGDAAYIRGLRYEAGEVEDIDCPVCFDKLSENGGRVSPNVVRLPCRHLFHYRCIQGWLDRAGDTPHSCPICRVTPRIFFR